MGFTHDWARSRKGRWLPRRVGLPSRGSIPEVLAAGLFFPSNYLGYIIWDPTSFVRIFLIFIGAIGENAIPRFNKWVKHVEIGGLHLETRNIAATLTYRSMEIVENMGYEIGVSSDFT